MTILILTNGNTITVKQSIYIILEMINSGDKFLDLSSLDYKNSVYINVDHIIRMHTQN